MMFSHIAAATSYRPTAMAPSWTPKGTARFRRQGNSARKLAKRSGGHISEQAQNRTALILLSYKYCIHPNRRQREALDEMLYWFCQLYNAGLQQRIEAYRRQGVSLTYKTQADELKLLRAEVPELGNSSFSAEQQVLRRLSKTLNAVFGRVKRGAKAFPRFKASARFHAADFRFGDGLTMKPGRRLSIVGILGMVKVK